MPPCPSAPARAGGHMANQYNPGYYVDDLIFYSNDVNVKKILDTITGFWFALNGFGIYTITMDPQMHEFTRVRGLWTQGEFRSPMSGSCDWCGFSGHRHSECTQPEFTDMYFWWLQNCIVNNRKLHNVRTHSRAFALDPRHTHTSSPCRLQETAYFSRLPNWSRGPRWQPTS